MTDADFDFSSRLICVREEASRKLGGSNFFEREIMSKGRKPKPNTLKLIEGNLGGRPLPEELECDIEIGDPPDWFNEEELAAWNHVIEVAPPNLLKGIDWNLIVLYCEAVAEHKEASLRLKREGYIVDASRGGTKRNDWHVVKNGAAEKIIKIGSEIGFSPASRSKVVPQGGKKGNKFGNNGKRSAS
jgi:P27 family predicted phage terminase small subunit